MNDSNREGKRGMPGVFGSPGIPLDGSVSAQVRYKGSARDDVASIDNEEREDDEL